MTVLLINPNSPEAMTQGALRAARTAAPDLEFEGWTSTRGPVSIEGPEDGARAIPPLLDLVVRASSQGAQAIILACFDDTGHFCSYLRAYRTGEFMEQVNAYDGVKFTGRERQVLSFSLNNTYRWNDDIPIVLT